MGFQEEDLTLDRFLGGALSIRQPKRGYRAGVDPVFLAASVPAAPGERVLELGCGVGVAALCLAHRVPDLSIAGVEVQPDYAELARRNAASNGIRMTVVTADLARLPDSLRAQTFDHVIANPPYFQRSRGTGSANAGRDKALGEQTALAVWADVATRRLAPGGRVTFIQKADRLADLLGAFDHRVGDVTIQPLAARDGRAAELVILRARKGARGALRLLAPLILHQGARHEKDGDSYRPEVSAILRAGAPLKFRD